ncbi:hypothetical protein ACIGZI_01075 [Streptomyces griseus]|uniref:hypothetical protein n=1 Tax=Streptomyces griseus TaxID=1911 RepID=UPI0037D5F286
MEIEPVDFSSVHEGDTVTFSRRDNGFGGSGDIATRTGTVTKVTDKTVTVECGDHWGKTGILRRADWHYRNVHRTAKATHRPYNAENVQYVDAGLIVTAVWVSDPAIDPAEALENILRRDLPYEMEVVAEATRFFKKEGAGFSGWVVSTGSGLNYGDAIPAKRQAMKELRWAVTERFAR